MSETSYDSTNETTYQSESENYLSENTTYLSDEYTENTENTENESTYNSLSDENTIENEEENAEDNFEEGDKENAEDNSEDDEESVYCSDGDDYDGCITDEDTEEEEELKEVRERMITRMRLKNDPNSLVGFVEAQIEKNDSENEKNIQN